MVLQAKKRSKRDDLSAVSNSPERWQALRPLSHTANRKASKARPHCLSLSQSRSNLLGNVTDLGGLQIGFVGLLPTDEYEICLIDEVDDFADLPAGATDYYDTWEEVEAWINSVEDFTLKLIPISLKDGLVHAIKNGKRSDVATICNAMQ